MNFYKRYMADYAKKTARLTLAQHGAYTLLLDELYTTESPLPASFDELYRVCRAMTKDEQKAVAFVAEMFFPLAEDGLRHNPRATHELFEAAPAMEAARLNGKKGGRPKKEPNRLDENNPVGFQNITQDEPNSKPPHSSEEYKRAKALSSPDAPATIPACPHVEIIELYGQHLPNLPQPKAELWDGARATALRERWRWLLTAQKKNGERYATTRAEGLEWFSRFFAYVGESDFLTGKGARWSCDLGWLVKSENFAKVVQGNYENEKAAA